MPYTTGVMLDAMRLPMRREAPGTVRRRVRETLLLHGVDPEVIGDAELLATELVTNAVLHAGSGEVEVFLIRDGASLFIECRDPSPELPEGGAPGLVETSGRGLFLVAEMAADHGVVVSGPGKSVWCELVAWP
ncbi:ATP-binding protein [Spirillospora sp. NPDC048911]|uniref:ATP-binding protein n=1 Tax=Spirillospora sp. NPDC048911 TaxID=3364527 RepID=UPI003718182A